MSPRDWNFRLEDMVEAIDLIEEYVKNMDRQSWSQDRKTIDAVIRNLEGLRDSPQSMRRSLCLALSPSHSRAGRSPRT